ncbi:MAG: HEAT repeat domain-containing protein [Methanobacterium sp.]|nr:HEAT repeat domain-containing protein [Methanobacterium sp.]
MTPDDKKKLNRERRGQILPEELDAYVKFQTEHLIEMLSTDNPQKRTIAATILGNRGDENAILPLCTSLKKEKALYSRIAMSETLSKIGEPAVPYLINLLGEIGNNQEKELPKKYFNKKSFPLARDMAARTLVNIGNPATPYLIKTLEIENNFKVQQAIDALGGIAAKTGDQRALIPLIKFIEKMNGQDHHNQITYWKIVRALSGFNNCKCASETLVKVLMDDQTPPIIWEAIRSLGQIGIVSSKINELLSNFKNSSHPEIKKSCENALINLSV